MLLPIPNKWTQQPQIVTGVDWENSITLGLVSAWSAPHNTYFGFGKCNLIGTVDVAINGLKGRSTFNAASNTELPVGAFSSAGVETRIAVITATGAAVRGTISARGIGDIGFRISVTGAIQVYLAGVGGLYDGAVVPIGRSSVAAILNDGTDSRLYQDGKQTSSGAGGPMLGNPIIGDDRTNEYFPGVIHAHFAFSRLLTPTEITSISVNPWQVFRPLV